MEGVLSFDIINLDTYTQEATGDDQYEIIMELEEWLENALNYAGIEFYDTETERIDEETVNIIVCDYSGDIIGNGSIQFDAI